MRHQEHRICYARLRRTTVACASLVLALCFAVSAASAKTATGPAEGAPAATSIPTATTSPTTSAPTTTSAPAAAPPLPDVASFRAIDRPSDDGTVILVCWAKPQGEPDGVKYIVEVAKSPEDFASGNFKSKPVTPSPKALASSKPKYFGYDEANANIYFVEISPAAMFPPSEPGNLTPERLKELAADKKISDQELAVALAVLEDKPDLKPADKKWFERLQAYQKSVDEKAAEEQAAKANSATWYFRLAVQSGGVKTYLQSDGKPAVVTSQAEANWFKWPKLNNLAFSLIFCGIVFTFIEVAKRKPGMFIRKIAGLEAVDEAIGRSTEMDRPVFFVHGGSSDMSSLATIAAVNILSRVARRTAEHDSRIRVMNNDPIVTAVSQEVVQQAYTEAGRPDAFNADDVSLVASDQFSYVAAVSGIMVREQPGAIFLLGSFFAESLLLAETGASTGAIQVAGTDEFTQLPFFITTCDYTLIGEELYAASAYLSREPRLLGSLRGQDVGKAFMMVAIVGGSLALTLATALGADWTWLRRLFIAN